MAAVLNSSSNLHSKLDCFTIEKIDPNVKIPIKIGYGTPSSLTGVSTIAANPSTKHFSILKSTISSAFPDYDFTDLGTSDFKRIIATEQIKSNISWQLSSSLPSATNLETHLWQAIETEISPNSCDIYQYEPESADVFSEMGAIWNYTYFFINEKQKKVLLLHLREGAHDFGSESGSEDMFDECDVINNHYSYNVF